MKFCSLSGLAQSGFYEVCRQFAAATVVGLTGVRYFNVPDLGGLGGLLIASNHQSYLDPVLVGMPFERQVHFMARKSLFGVPGFGLLIRGLSVHPVQRGEVDTGALRTALGLLRAGEALVVFPEGTRTRNGAMGTFKPGVGSIAARCGVPALPVCLEGAFECWPRSAAFPRPARVAVAFGDLLWPKDRDGRAVTRAMVEQIEGMQKFLRNYMGRSAPESGDTCSQHSQSC